MELSKGIALFVGCLTGALAGIGVILYACGYLPSPNIGGALAGAGRHEPLRARH